MWLFLYYSFTTFGPNDDRKPQQEQNNLKKKKKKRPGQDYPDKNSSNGPKGLNWRTRLPPLMFNWKFSRIASYNFPSMKPG